MSEEGATTTERLSASDVVAQLLTLGTDKPVGDLRGLVERAQGLADESTADEWAATLLEALETSPEDRDLLLALLVLGMSHPALRERNHDAFIGEGRRLAILWERDELGARAHELLDQLCRIFPGERVLESELAALMRRSGNLDRLVERHVQRAEQAAAKGRRREAITWLREALTLDGSRRDLARMIRDLQYADTNRIRWGRCFGLSALALAVILSAVGVVWRDRSIRAEFDAIAPAVSGDRSSTQARLTAIDLLIARNVFWTGLFDAGRERAELRAQVSRLELQAERREDQERSERELAGMQAEALCADARAQAGVGSLELALAYYEQALRLAPADWPGRVRANSDRAAIVQWLAEKERHSNQPAPEAQAPVEKESSP